MTDIFTEVSANLSGDLTWISPMTDEVEHFQIYLLVLCILFFVCMNCLFILLASL